MIKRLIQDLAPVLAGFQITVALVGSIGLGTIANWILIHWIPFTRLIWSKVLLFINLPDISPEEKDALTAIAFFLPMAISTLWTTRECNTSHELRIRIYTTIVGLAFFAVIGQGVLNDMLRIVQEGTEKTVDLFDLSAITALIAMFASIISSLEKPKQKPTLEDMMYGMCISLLKIPNLLKKQAKRNQIFLLSPIMILLLFSSIYVAPELGIIRAISPFLILICLFLTVFLNPSRLLATFGVVLAFIATSMVYDAIILFVSYIESLTSVA